MATVQATVGVAVALRTLKALTGIWQSSKRDTQFTTAADELQAAFTLIRESKTLDALQSNIANGINDNPPFATQLADLVRTNVRTNVSSKDLLFILEGFKNVHNVKKRAIVSLLMNILVSENNFPKFAPVFFDAPTPAAQIRNRMNLDQLLLAAEQYNTILVRDDFQPDRDLAVRDLLGIAFVLTVQATDVTRVFVTNTDSTAFRKVVRKQSLLHALLAEQLVTVRFGLTVFLATYAVWLRRNAVGRNDAILNAPLRPGLSLLMKEGVEEFGLSGHIHDFNTFLPDESKLEDDPLLFATAAKTRTQMQLDPVILMRQYVHYFLSHALFDLREDRSVVRNIQLDTYTSMAQRFRSKDAVLDLASVLPVVFSFMEYLLLEDVLRVLFLSGAAGKGEDHPGFANFWNIDRGVSRFSTHGLRAHIWDRLRNSLVQYTEVVESELLLNMVEVYAEVTFFHATTDLPAVVAPDVDLFPNSGEDWVFADIWRMWRGDGIDVAPNEAAVAELLYSVAATLLRPAVKAKTSVRTLFRKEPAMLLQTTVSVLFQLRLFFNAAGDDMRDVHLPGGLDTQPTVTLRQAMSDLVVAMSDWTQKRGRVNADDNFFERIERYVDTFPRTFRTLQRRLQRGRVAQVAVDSDRITLWRMGRLLLLYAFELGAPVPGFLRDALLAYLALMAVVLTHGYENPRPLILGEETDAALIAVNRLNVHIEELNVGAVGEEQARFIALQRANAEEAVRRTTDLIEQAEGADQARRDAAGAQVPLIAAVDSRSNFRTDINPETAAEVTRTLVHDFLYPHTNAQVQNELRKIIDALAVGRVELMSNQFAADPTNVALTELVDKVETAFLEYKLLWQELAVFVPRTQDPEELAHNHNLHAGVLLAADALVDMAKELEDVLVTTLRYGPQFKRRDVEALVDDIRTTLIIYTVQFLEGNVRATGRCDYVPDATQNFLGETIL